MTLHITTYPYIASHDIAFHHTTSHHITVLVIWPGHWLPEGLDEGFLAGLNLVYRLEDILVHCNLGKESYRNDNIRLQTLVWTCGD